MDTTSLIAFIVTGFVIGGFAENPTRGVGPGLVGSILIGVVGGVVGGHLLGSIEFLPDGVIGSVIAAAIGAVGLLFIASKVRR